MLWLASSFVQLRPPSSDLKSALVADSIMA
jgi:hypothetical protein